MNNIPSSGIIHLKNGDRELLQMQYITEYELGRTLHEV